MPYRVLVVDDSGAQRRLLFAVLERAGFDVLTAASAEEALEICQGPEGDRIRIVISDWQMPGLDGPEFCAAFRRLRGDTFAYFILVTSHSELGTKTKGLRAGADDFLTRPIDLAELHARIAAGRRVLHMQEVLEHRNHEIQKSLADLQAMKDAVDRDLLEARKLQRAFLPDDSHRVGDTRLSLRLLPCQQIGGDLVGWFDISATEVALYSVDVSGHGIASALMTGRLAGLFRDTEVGRNIAFTSPDGRPDPPERVMQRLNDLMLAHFDTDIYFTAVLAYVDLVTGEMRVCRAGHPHLLIRRADGTVQKDGKGGLPVGMFPGVTFEAETLWLQPGDLVFAYSDGLTESTDTWGDMLEEEGLIDLLATVRSDATQAIDDVEHGLRRHAGIQGFDDDVSMVAMLYQPMEPSAGVVGMAHGLAAGQEAEHRRAL
ncbi:PP2C family protein-serine/threonine phosphatase [Jannaschia formosa]|uniref:PP2C family protein-serine/threonine phosphatase n=1 Tax=Jannaschia formosa TaxID=2259592 RepID=UPI001431063B|nr:SpoIIE family protein phosphatase [Jannaschia formosa]